MSQLWSRLYGYIEEYHRLVYDYYSKTAVAFLTTYYNINKTETVWEDEKLFGGAYERIGDLSGIKFDKYLLLPVYFPDEVSTSFDGQEIGMIKMNQSTITIPSSYGLTPYPGDLLKFDQTFLRSNDNTYPVFVVGGIEIHPNTDYRFWKLKIETFQSVTTTQIDAQVADNYVFFDYDKKIHTVEDATMLADILSKIETLKERISSYYDSNNGFYSV